MSTFAALALALFLAAVGTSHFVLPGYFRTLVPAWLAPAAGYLVVLSGLAELLLAALLLVPETRALAGWAAAALITGYLVSHVDALVRADPAAPRVLDRPIGALARVTVNLVYIAWAAAVALTS